MGGNRLQRLKEQFDAPTPKKARRERFWSLLTSALSLVTMIGSSIVDVEILSSTAGKWTMAGIALISGVNAFIQQLKTE